MSKLLCLLCKTSHNLFLRFFFFFYFSPWSSHLVHLSPPLDLSGPALLELILHCPSSRRGLSLSSTCPALPSSPADPSQASSNYPSSVKVSVSHLPTQFSFHFFLLLLELTPMWIIPLYLFMCVSPEIMHFLYQVEFLPSLTPSP